MIGHQQAATGITALKSTLQEGEEATQVTQENGKEMEEVAEPPKVNNPALEAEAAGDTTAVASVTENGTNNGDAPVEKPADNNVENNEEEGEGEDPIDMTFPAKDGWKAILVYIISFPIMGPLFITLPDTKNEKSAFFIPFWNSWVFNLFLLQKRNSFTLPLLEAYCGSHFIRIWWYGGPQRLAKSLAFLMW